MQLLLLILGVILLSKRYRLLNLVLRYFKSDLRLFKYVKICLKLRVLYRVIAWIQFGFRGHYERRLLTRSQGSFSSIVLFFKSRAFLFKFDNMFGTELIRIRFTIA